jgi:hypothetical protein
MKTKTLDRSARYQVQNQGAVAWRIVGVPKEWEPNISLVTRIDHDDDEACAAGTCECPEIESEEDSGDGEWIEKGDCGLVICVMVGDDHKWVFDVDDLAAIDEDDYCHECGQTGCRGDARDRSV